LIDGDGIDNYATINGVSKIVKIRGPETWFNDPTVWDSVRSVDTSYRDAYKVLSPEGQKIADTRLGEKNRELYGEDGKFHDYKQNAPKPEDKSAEAEMYRWLVAQGKNPADGIPFYNEPLKYPKQFMSPEAKTEVTGLREQLKAADLPESTRAQLDGRLLEISHLNAKEWNDYDFGVEIRDHMTDILRGQARMDGKPPGEFSSVRGTTGSDTQAGSSAAPGSAGGPNNPDGFLNGRPLQFHDNQLQLGRDFNVDMRDDKFKGLVSDRHASVRFDPATGEMKLTDTSERGTYIKRAGSKDWEMVQGRETTIGPEDEIRLGSPKGPEVKLSAPERSDFTARGGSPDVKLFIGDKPVDMTPDGTMAIGRNFKGADGKPIIEGERVSRDHGTLRYDKATDTYYYKDNNSTNGTFINGEKIEPGKEFAVKPTDDIRLGTKDGPQLKLMSLVSDTSFNTSRDAAVFINGTEAPLNFDGTMKVGRDINGLGDMRVSRDQGSLRFWDADKSFYYTDNSQNGTYILRGDHYERLPKGQEVKIRPEDDVRLGSVDGPRLELFNKNAGSRAQMIDRQVYVGNQQARFDGYTGDIKVGTNYQSFGNRDNINLVSADHGSLKVDPNSGDLIYTDHSRNGSYVKHLDGTFEEVRGRDITVKSGEEIHLGSQDGPIVKMNETPGRKLPDGSVIFRRDDGDLIKREDGSTVFDDRAGIRRVNDASGRVLEASTPANGRAYGYNEKGELNKVTFSDGQVYESTDGQNWKITAANGSETQWHGKMTVESDGALRFDDGYHPPMVRRLDGSEELQWPNGHVEYKNANIYAEQQRLDALIKHNFQDAGQAQRFREMINGIQRRTDISQQEIADTLHQINRLLATGGEAAVPMATRTRLAEQLSYSASRPDLIDQGYNKTCNVATAESRAFLKSPSDAVRMVTDVALTGKYTTPSGVTVDVGRLGALKPDGEALMAFQNPYHSGTYADIRSIDGARTYASQLFEETAVNVNFALHPETVDTWAAAGVKYQPGDVVAYKKIDVPGQTETGERLVIYRKDANGIVHEIEAGRAPNLRSSDIEEVYRNIVPGKDAQGRPIPNQERGFIWNGPGQDNGFVVNSDQELVANLWSAQQQGGMPIILKVRGDDPLINNNGKPDGTHPWHFITVRSISWVNGQPRIEYTNQWGTKFDHMGPKAVSPADLYRAMN
jgi:hypothetical protein